MIEDAAQSAGAKYKGKPVGSLVDLTCFSFNPVKNLGAIGDAGAVTGRRDLIDKVKMYRDHGRNSKYNYDAVGFNARIDCLQAAVLLEKMQYYEKWINGKIKVCERYNDELECVTPLTRPENQHSYYVYVIQIPNRDGFVEYMKDLS